MHSFEYDLTADDYAAFNLHHLMTSEMGRRQRRAHRLNSSVLTAILCAALATLILRDTTASLLAGVAGAGVGVAGSALTWGHDVRRSIRRMASRDGLGASGRHVLTLGPETIQEDGPSATVSAPWSSLVRVDETADHLFIYTDPVRAFVVPVRIGPEKVAELRALISPHMAGPS